MRKQKMKKRKEEEDDQIFHEIEMFDLMLPLYPISIKKKLQNKLEKVNR